MFDELNIKLGAGAASIYGSGSATLIRTLVCTRKVFI
jgi:hypothetical protein